MSRCFLFASMVVLAGFSASAAMATDGCFYPSYGRATWGGMGRPPFGAYGGAPWGGYMAQDFNIERHPYFAMYPPVYYNGIEPRTFGQTPYADLPPISGYQPYPPVVYYDQSQQQQQPVRPLMIRNPYVTQPAAPQPSTPQAPQPTSPQ